MTAAITIYLVRHGEANSPWSEAKNAGLSETGRRQVDRVAEEFASLRPLHMISSPMRRARETAQPLGRLWAAPALIDERFREVPLSSHSAERKAWLKEVTHMRWREVDDVITQWRDTAWEAMLAFERSTVVFTHFMLINAMVSRATGDERLVCLEPDYASVTRLRVKPGTECFFLESDKR
jgi:probable phosphoglycerate mutase